MTAVTSVEYATVYPQGYNADGAFINPHGELIAAGLLYNNAELIM